MMTENNKLQRLTHKRGLLLRFVMWIFRIHPEEFVDYQLNVLTVETHDIVIIKFERHQIPAVGSIKEHLKRLGVGRAAIAIPAGIELGVIKMPSVVTQGSKSIRVTTTFP